MAVWIIRYHRVEREGASACRPSRDYLRPCTATSHADGTGASRLQLAGPSDSVQGNERRLLLHARGMCARIIMEGKAGGRRASGLGPHQAKATPETSGAVNSDARDQETARSKCEHRVDSSFGDSLDASLTAEERVVSILGATLYLSKVGKRESVRKTNEHCKGVSADDEVRWAEKCIRDVNVV